MSFIQRTPIADGVYFNSVRDSRFKTMKLTVHLFVPLSAEAASENALIAGVLSRSCKAYPDFTALSRKLSALYGADLNVSSAKVGENQVISISASGLDDRYAIDGESIAKELSVLLCGVIFEPNLSGKAFVAEEVEQERRQLLDLIDSEYNEKRIYANARLIEIMCADEVFGIKRYGTAEAIQAATPQSLYTAWEKLLRDAVAEIIYIGDSSPEKAVEVFTAAFQSIPRTPVTLHTEVIREAGEVKRVTEEIEVSQSKLVMGTAGYMAPEVQAGHDATPAADVYSLGVMFFHLLTGLWYEPGTKALALLDGFKYQWRDVLSRMLSVNPQERPLPLSDLPRQLQPVGSTGRAVAPRPPRRAEGCPPYLAQPRSSRRPSTGTPSSARASPRPWRDAASPRFPRTGSRTRRSPSSRRRNVRSAG